MNASGTPLPDTAHQGWRKATRSNQDGGCIEILSRRSTLTAVRDSKHSGGPTLTGRHGPLDVLALVRWAQTSPHHQNAHGDDDLALTGHRT